MRGFRRKLSAPLREFSHEIDRLLKFDADNQRRYSSSSSLRRDRLTKSQLILLTESLFFSAFCSFENFIRDVFLLYCFGKKTISGKKVSSFLKPKNYRHAEELIQSSMPHVDWSNPNIIINRAEIYLERGFPIKAVFTSNREAFLDLKRIRNHIAHRSKESLEQYKKVLIKHYSTIPLSIPSPGEFLLVIDKNDPTKYKLQLYFLFLNQIASAIV